MKTLAALILLALTGCASKAPPREPSSAIIGHQCVSGGVLVRVLVQSDEPNTLTLQVPLNVCGEPT